MNPEPSVLDIQILSPLLTLHNHSFSLHSDSTSSPHILQVITENGEKSAAGKGPTIRGHGDMENFRRGGK